MKNKILTFLSAFLLHFVGFAGEADALFEKGNQAFQQGKFAAAADIYEAALQTGEHAPEVYVNLGHAYFRQKMYAKAILNYERARLLQPNDMAIKNDLLLTQERLDLEPSDGYSTLGLFRVGQQLRDRLSPNGWAGLALTLMWLIVGGVWVFWRGKEQRQRMAGKWMAGILAPLLLLSLWLAQSSAQNATNHTAGIVMVKSAPLHADPDKNTDTIETLPEGTKVLVLDLIGEWWKVQLPTGEEGWLEKAAIESI